jgi:plasmid stability protein
VLLKNLTIKIDDELARWARVWAAEHETSVSQVVADLLRKLMLQERGYDAAMEQWLAWTPRPLRDEDEPLPTRDELHGR